VKHLGGVGKKPLLPIAMEFLAAPIDVRVAAARPKALPLAGGRPLAGYACRCHPRNLQTQCEEHWEQIAMVLNGTPAAAQNAAEPCIASLPLSEPAECDVKRGPATSCENPMGRVGPEHPPLSLSETAISAEDGAKSGALPAPDVIHDADLTEITAAWPKLPEHIRAAIIALVRTQGREQER